MAGGAPFGPSTLCSIPSHGMVADIFIGCPSPSIPVTVRLIPFPSDANTTVSSLLRVPAVPLDFAVFSFHVPKNGLSATTRATEKTQNTARRCSPLILPSFRVSDSISQVTLDREGSSLRRDHIAGATGAARIRRCTIPSDTRKTCRGVLGLPLILGAVSERDPAF